MPHSLRIAICVLAFTAVSACGNKTQAPAAQQQAAITPADPALAKLYAQTCKACHGNPGNPAPQAGDKAAWQPRAAQGMETLLNHTLNGYKGMPPLGSCGDCGQADFEALIRFMSGMEGA